MRRNSTCSFTAAYLCSKMQRLVLQAYRRICQLSEHPNRQSRTNNHATHRPSRKAVESSSNLEREEATSLLFATTMQGFADEPGLYLCKRIPFSGLC